MARKRESSLFSIFVRTGTQEAQQDVLHELIQKYSDLAEQSIRQKEILDRLIGYSLTNESET